MKPIVKSYRYTKCCSVVYHNSILYGCKMLHGSQCSTGPASRSTGFSQPLVSQLLTRSSSLHLPASAICPLECIQNASAWLVFSLWNSLMLRLCCLPIRRHFWLLYYTANGLTPTTFNLSSKLHPSPAITVKQFCLPSSLISPYKRLLLV